jgi:hypothetical protein
VIARQPFPILDQVPPELRGIVLDFRWDRERLWALDLPVREVALSDLAWQLRLPWWAHDGQPFTLTPDQVAYDPATYRQQYVRTQASDLRFPICALQRAGDITVLDGVHRLLKARLSMRETILVKVVSPGMLDAIASSQGS